MPITPLLNGQFAICWWGHTDASRWTKFGLWVPGSPALYKNISEPSAGILSFSQSRSLLIPLYHKARFLEDAISSTSTPEHFVPDTRQSDWSQPFTTAANTHLTRSSDAGVNQRATCTPILHKYTTVTAERVQWCNSRWNLHKHAYKLNHRFYGWNACRKKQQFTAHESVLWFYGVSHSALTVSKLFISVLWILQRNTDVKHSQNIHFIRN